MKEDKMTPLVLVSYLDRETIGNNDIMNELQKSVDYLIIEKGYDIMMFFLPTDGDERLECINPVLASDEQKNKIDDLINDIKLKFDIDEKNKKEGN